MERRKQGKKEAGMAKSERESRKRKKAGMDGRRKESRERSGESRRPNRERVDKISFSAVVPHLSMRLVWPLQRQR